ncbi:MAG: copper-binding protein [Phenylobacterium sp.]|nr:MAG: copper-binding protein [Phenylobacterium sp.]
MLKRAAPILFVLAIAGAAHAQMGQGGGGGRGGRGGHGGGSKPSSQQSAPSSTPAKAAPTPTNQIVIVGVVKAIDLETQRVTIAYEPVEALNWPAGSNPFPVSKTAMLTAARVGQKVKFSIDSGQISAIGPFDPAP